MSKREKNNEVVEEDKKVNNQIETSLKIGSIDIGVIKQDGKRFVALLPNGETFKAVSHEEAVNLLIREYHLHRN